MKLFLPAFSLKPSFKLLSSSFFVLLVFLYQVHLKGESPQPTGASEEFRIELFEDVPQTWSQDWSFSNLAPAVTWKSPALGVAMIPDKLSPAGQAMHRAKPFALRIQGPVELTEGQYEFHLRSRMHARFHI